MLTGKKRRWMNFIYFALDLTSELKRNSICDSIDCLGVKSAFKLDTLAHMADHFLFHAFDAGLALLALNTLNVAPLLLLSALKNLDGGPRDRRPPPRRRRSS